MLQLMRPTGASGRLCHDYGTARMNESSRRVDRPATPVSTRYHAGDIRSIPPGNKGQQAHCEPMIRFKALKIMRGATMNVYYFDLSNEPASLPLEALLASFAANGVEH